MGSRSRYLRWKNRYPKKTTKTGNFRLPSHLDKRGENVGFRRERLRPLLPLTPPPCHPQGYNLLASLLIRSRNAYSHVITNSLGVVVAVGVFAIMPYPWHRIAQVQNLPPLWFPQRPTSTSSTRTRRASGEEAEKDSTRRTIELKNVTINQIPAVGRNKTRAMSAAEERRPPDDRARNRRGRGGRGRGRGGRGGGVGSDNDDGGGTGKGRGEGWRLGDGGVDDSDNGRGDGGRDDESRGDRDGGRGAALAGAAAAGGGARALWRPALPYRQRRAEATGRLVRRRIIRRRRAGGVAGAAAAAGGGTRGTSASSSSGSPSPRPTPRRSSPASRSATRPGTSPRPASS